MLALQTRIHNMGQGAFSKTNGPRPRTNPSGWIADGPVPFARVPRTSWHDAQGRNTLSRMSFMRGQKTGKVRRTTGRPAGLRVLRHRCVSDLSWNGVCSDPSTPLAVITLLSLCNCTTSV